MTTYHIGDPFIEISIPKYSPIIDTCWHFIVDAVMLGNSLADLTHIPTILRKEVEDFKIMTRRMAVIKTGAGIEWYHICRPRKLAKSIRDEVTTLNAPWLELQWTMGHFNPTKNTKCWGCYRQLTKAEMLLMKAAILDIRT